jgi:MFS transporter, DHA2 family, multidrug resistance protein
MEERREQFHTLRLNEWLTRFHPVVNARLDQIQAYYLQTTGDTVLSQRMALGTVADIREQQAASLAYFDVFWAFAVLAIGLVFLVLFMKRSVVEKGAHISAE